MTKLIKTQKRLAVMLVSVALMLYRTVSLARPAKGQNGQSADVKAGLLLRIPLPWRNPAASGRYYAAELNGSFPYVHVQQVSASALHVPLAYADNVLEMSDVLGVTAFSLDDPQIRTAGVSGNPQQPMPLEVIVDDDDDDDCGGCGCGDCGDCTDCTDCSDCTCG